MAAEIRCFTKSGDRAFEVVGDSREFLLAPGASSVVTVRCHMDQTTRHADTLCVMVTESGVVTIPIDAEGTGSLLTCDELFTAPGGNGENPTQHPGHVDFGNQLVARPFSREFVVTNNSRIPQQLVWQNVSAEEKRRVAVLEKKKVPGDDLAERRAEQFLNGQNGRRHGNRVLCGTGTSIRAS